MIQPGDFFFNSETNTVGVVVKRDHDGSMVRWYLFLPEERAFKRHPVNPGLAFMHDDDWKNHGFVQAK